MLTYKYTLNKVSKVYQKKILPMIVDVNGINIKLALISVKTMNAGQLNHLHPK